MITFTYIKNRITHLSYLFVLLLLLLLFSCSKHNNFDKLIQSSNKIGKTQILLYPYDLSVFPLDIISPTIRWEPNIDSLKWIVQITIPNKDINITYSTSANEYRISKEDWDLLKKYPDEKIQINLIGFKNGNDDEAVVKDKREITISKDRVDAPIFYRTVTLPFGYAVDHLETISWRLGYISDEEQPKKVLSNVPVCGNCHSFSSDGNTLGMDVDYGNDKGAYAIADITPQINFTKNSIITWTDYKKEDGEQTFGLLSALSPDGRYAISTVKDRSVFVKQDNLEYSQLFFPIKGILVYYDKLTKTFNALKGADDKNFVNSNPIWFPDVKKIIFAKTNYYKLPEIEKSKSAVLPVELAQDFVKREKLYKYDLYTVDFNNGKGGVAQPLLGASNNNMSNYFPKVSPNGKWIVFTQAESFMLLMPDSKLYIIPSNGGKPRLMNCNLQNMNSWHSWSPNGKWLVFSSKANGPFTQLYLTHIDENGNDSPPVLLENFRFDNLAANIPEFINLKDKKNKKFFTINTNFITTDYYGLQMGKNKIVQGDFVGAIKDLTETLKDRPNDYDCYNMRAIAYSELKKYDSSLSDFSKCIEIKPSHEAFYNRGATYFLKNDFNTAIADFNKSINLNANDEKSIYKRALSYYNVSNYKEALNDFNKYLQIRKNEYKVYYERALTEIQLGLLDKACEDLHFAKANGIDGADELIQKVCK